MNVSTSVYAQASELVALRRKCQLLMRMVLGIVILWLATMLMNFIGAANASEKISSTNVAAIPNAKSLRVREIVVVDANGTPRVKFPAWVVGIAFRPTGQLVAGCSDGIVRVLNPSTGVIERTIHCAY